MDTLRDKIEDAVYDVQDGVNYITGTDTIMHIIENHIEWTDPKSCDWGHVFSKCGTYEITDSGTLYCVNVEIGEYTTVDAAKQAAQSHKEASG